MNSLYRDRVVRIHSVLAEGGQGIDSRGFNAIALWYWVRSLDTEGSGKVSFRILDAEVELERSKSTIKRYLENGLALGLFRSVEVRYGRVVVYYASTKAIAIRQGLMHWGAVAEVPVSDLQNLRVVATEVQAFSLQNSSVYLAKQSTPKGLRAKVIKPEDVLLKASLCSAGENVVHVGKRCMFVEPESVLVGVSQERIAETLRRNVRTVRRRLSNSWRSQRGIAPILKKQLAQTKPEFDAVGFELSQAGVSGSDRYFVCKGLTWRSGCNIYYQDVSLTSNKAAKHFYRDAVRELMHGVEQIKDLNEQVCEYSYE